MEIISGLFDNMVLQRGAKDVSNAAFSGACSVAGIVTATVMRRASKRAVLKSGTVGKAAGGRLRGTISGVPTGGPYDIALCIENASGARRDELTIRNILVGDVWILAGQSNMEGVGYRKDGLKPHPLVRAFYMDDHWGIAEDPLHRLWTAVDQVHVDLIGGSRIPGSPHIGVGPGMSYALEMRSKTGIPQGLICCAHGGTSMAQWDPGMRDQGGKSLYGAMMRRFRKNGGGIAGVLWYQGCSEADPALAELYTARMKALIACMRKDFKRADLPVVMVQISRVVTWKNAAVGWNMVREAQRLLPRAVRRLSAVTAIDLSLDDFIHLAGFSQNRLGRRLAYAMLELTKQKKGLKPPIALRKVRVERDPLNLWANVILEYDHVEGRLRADGMPWGFDLSMKKSEITNDYIYRIDLEKNRVVLKTAISAIEAESMFLFYGFGTNPFCNITDSADRSLPAIGGLRVGRAHAFADYVRKMRISPLLPLAGTIVNAEYPDTTAFPEREFGDGFLNLHNEIGATTPRELIVYYAVTVECSQDMRLNVHLGYDGPVRAWFDKQEVFLDAAGTNPCVPSKGVFAVTASAGIHELVIGLASNGGKAWGIFLRFERADVDARTIEKGEEHYSMPRVAG
jgi:sialate O-acetylesterase